MVGFRKGALGCPFSTEYQGNKGIEMGRDNSDVGPRVGSGVMGKRVTMDVQRESEKGDGGAGRTMKRRERK